MIMVCSQEYVHKAVLTISALTFFKIRKVNWNDKADVYSY